jgi:cytoskeletal protein CcmA (bactofilin family)
MDISTNATGVVVVALSGNAVINGDAEVGPGGNPDTDITTNGNVAVNGNKGTAETTKDMTAMTDPGGGTPETLSVSGNNTKTISSGTYRLPNISISGNAKGEICGDVTLYLDGNTNISGNANLKILPRGSLTIYASGTVNISVNGIVNQNIAPRPEEYVLLETSSCTSITISGNGDLYATIYAPTATTSVTGNGDVYGSLVGNTVTISGNGDVLFDEYLQNLAVGEISDFNVTLWKYLNM